MPDAVRLWAEGAHTVTTTERRRVVVVLGVACMLAVTLAACGDDQAGPADPGVAGIEAGGEPADPKGAAAIPGVEFTASAEVVDDGVVVDYELVNGSTAKVYLPNRVGRGDDYGRISHDAAFVYVTGAAHGGVELAKRVFATPDTDRKSWGQPPTVAVTGVAPGDRVSESFTVPLPLERHQPWGNDYGYGEVSLPDRITRIRFCLGVLEAPLPPAAGIEKDDDGQVVRHGNASNTAQHLYCSDPVEP